MGSVLRSQKQPQHLAFFFLFRLALGSSLALGLPPAKGGSAPAGMLWKAGGDCMGTAAVPGATATGDAVLVTTKLAFPEGDGTNPEPGWTEVMTGEPVPPGEGTKTPDDVVTAGAATAGAAMAAVAALS
eukprot:CAMPEP_0114651014 /NCGR_PEP_ID=MMETSP0191-20121206/8051_1 /TAXON_ID=126664 /ORGANISM="Sorites sp." /LENGTH=128 /DNA_ID=CAMNT_0001865067 /DNA_START=91 /DNA_END=478 /DNA_ORIENTATION=-